MSVEELPTVDSISVHCILIGFELYEKIHDLCLGARAGVVQRCVAVSVKVVRVEALAQEHLDHVVVLEHGGNAHQVVALRIDHLLVNLEAVKHLFHSAAVTQDGVLDYLPFEFDGLALAVVLY